MGILAVAILLFVSERLRVDVVVMVVLAVDILYMILVGRRLLPERTPGGGLIDSYPVQEYLTEVRVAKDSPLVGKTVQEADLEHRRGLNVIHVHLCCQEGETVSATTEHRLQPGDELHLEATANAIHKWTMLELLSHQVPLPLWVAPKRRGRPLKRLPQPELAVAV